MKAAANGVLNLSVPDGWWDEVWNDPRNSRKMGWAIGKGEDYSDRNEQDQVEAAALYDLLERDVIPAFYERGADRIPRRWVERMKASVVSLCPFVNTHRMVRDYVEGYYMKAHAQFRSLDADGARRVRELSSALERIRAQWPEVGVEKVEDGPSDTVTVSSSMPVQATVHLGSLAPQDVVVELYVGRINGDGDLVEGVPVGMQPQGQPAGGSYIYTVQTSIECSGLHGFTVRVRPSHADLPAAFVPGLIRWAAEARE
jgi:starch phosphorylase